MACKAVSNPNCHLSQLSHSFYFNDRSKKANKNTNLGGTGSVSLLVVEKWVLSWNELYLCSIANRQFCFKENELSQTVLNCPKDLGQV